MNTYLSKLIRLSLVYFCFLAVTVRATIVHIIPLWQDKKTKKWEIMLSRNTGTALWTDFDHASKGEPYVVARATIKDFTRGRYNEKNMPLKSGVDLIEYGQHFWFVPVSERVDNWSMRKARNSFKMDFTWVSMDEFLGFTPVHDPRQRKSGRITADPNLRATVRILWPEVQKKLK